MAVSTTTLSEFAGDGGDEDEADGMNSGGHEDHPPKGPDDTAPAPAQTTLASFDQDPDADARDDAATPLEQTVSTNAAKIETLKETVDRLTDLVDRLAEQQAADPDTASDAPESTPDDDPGETPPMFQ
jgi:hypothetical protein